uniref:Uncharacterized protein n=1 Tax=Cryptomonas curvata TaxID=233186 RepID=A0A7S0N9B5_9CRYP
MAPGDSVAFDLESANPIDATIILDHFDHVIQMANWENFLKSYAHNAFESRRFNLMLCVTSEAHVSRILGLNGGRKFKYLGLDIPNYGRWLEPQVNALVDKVVKRTASHSPIQDSDKQRLIGLAVRAGSPYPIIEAWDRGFDNIDWRRIELLANIAAEDWAAAENIKPPEDLAAERGARRCAIV